MGEGEKWREREEMKEEDVCERATEGRGRRKKNEPLQQMINDGGQDWLWEANEAGCVDGEPHWLKDQAQCGKAH